MPAMRTEGDITTLRLHHAQMTVAVTLALLGAILVISSRILYTRIII